MESRLLAVEFFLTYFSCAFGYNNKNNALVCKNANIEAHYSQGLYSKGSE